MIHVDRLGRRFYTDVSQDIMPALLRPVQAASFHTRRSGGARDLRKPLDRESAMDQHELIRERRNIPVPSSQEDAAYRQRLREKSELGAQDRAEAKSKQDASELAMRTERQLDRDHWENIRGEIEGLSDQYRDQGPLQDAILQELQRNSQAVRDNTPGYGVQGSVLLSPAEQGEFHRLASLKRTVESLDAQLKVRGLDPDKARSLNAQRATALLAWNESYEILAQNLQTPQGTFLIHDYRPPTQAAVLTPHQDNQLTRIITDKSQYQQLLTRFNNLRRSDTPTDIIDTARIYADMRDLRRAWTVKYDALRGEVRGSGPAIKRVGAYKPIDLPSKPKYKDSARQHVFDSAAV